MRSYLSISLTVLLTAVLLGAGCVSTGEYENLAERKESQIQGLETTIQELRSDLEEANQENSRLRDRIATLEAELEIARSAQPDFSEQLSEIQAVDVAPEGQLRLEGDFFFAPGRAEIRDEAQESIRQLADVLSDENLIIRIAGHTDNDPIRETADIWETETNMELGAYRALNVFLALRNQGVSPEHMHIVSFGPYRPRVPNNSPENKAKNRRVEILVRQANGDLPDVSTGDNTNTPQSTTGDDSSDDDSEDSGQTPQKGGNNGSNGNGDDGDDSGGNGGNSSTPQKG